MMTFQGQKGIQKVPTAQSKDALNPLGCSLIFVPWILFHCGAACTHTVLATVNMLFSQIYIPR